MASPILLCSQALLSGNGLRWNKSLGLLNVGVFAVGVTLKLDHLRF
jgi:hypothetical protein